MKGSKSARKKPAKKTRTLEESLVEDLLERKEEYERYFGEKKGEPDHKAVSAYATLIKMIVSIKKGVDIPDEEISEEELRKQTDDILEAEYGIKRSN